MQDSNPQVPTFPMNRHTIEIAFLNAMAATAPTEGLDIRFDYEPGLELYVDLSCGGHFLSGETPEGPLAFDLARGLDIEVAWARFERELVSLHIESNHFE